MRSSNRSPRLASTLSLAAFLTLPHGAFAAGAIYQGTIGDAYAQARLAFENDKVSGVVCVEASGLALRQTMYQVQGENPPGKISARLISSGRPAGSLDAERKLTDDQVSWSGKIVIGGATEKFELSRPRQQLGASAPATEFKSDDMYPNALEIWIDMPKFDQALALLKQLEAVSDIHQENAYQDPVLFIYDNYVSACTKQLFDHVDLHLTVDPYKLREVYQRLVSSGLFLGVSTIAVPKGPDSIEISIPRKFFGASDPSHEQISAFLDALIERYFRQLRQSQDACRKPNGENVLASLMQMQPSDRSSVNISPMQTGSFHVRRFEIKGLSKDLVFGLDSHWEDYKIELNLYPTFYSTDYGMQITVTTGLIAPFQEASPPPVERYRPINDNQLNNFMQKFAACVSKYVTGGCTEGVEAVVSGYCPQRQQ